ARLDRAGRRAAVVRIGAAVVALLGGSVDGAVAAGVVADRRLAGARPADLDHRAVGGAAVAGVRVGVVAGLRLGADGAITAHDRGARARAVGVAGSTGVREAVVARLGLGADLAVAAGRARAGVRAGGVARAALVGVAVVAELVADHHAVAAPLGAHRRARA